MKYLLKRRKLPFRVLLVVALLLPFVSSCSSEDPKDQPPPMCELPTIKPVDVPEFLSGVAIPLDQEFTFDVSDPPFLIDKSNSVGWEFSWDFGDLETLPYSQETRVNHTYTRVGRYTVILRVRNHLGRFVKSIVANKIVHRPLSPQSPSNSSTIISDKEYVFKVNPDNNSVSAIDTGNHTKVWENKVGKHPRTLSQGPHGRIWVTIQGDDKIVILERRSGEMANEIPLPYGSAPYGIVFTPQKRTAYVALENKGQIVEISLADGNCTFSEPNYIDAGIRPRGIAISSDSRNVFVTRFISSPTHAEIKRFHRDEKGKIQKAFSAFSLEIDTTTEDSDASGRGLPNYLTSMAISPGSPARLFIPSKKDNILRGQARDSNNLNHENTVRSILSSIDLSSDSSSRGPGLSINRYQFHDFDDKSLPNAVVFSPLGGFAFISLMGSNVVDVIDTDTASEVATLETGPAPDGMALTHDGRKLWVSNFLGRSVTVYDLENLLNLSGEAEKLADIPVVSEELLTETVLSGKKVFYDASDSRMSQDGYISCSTCHLDGGDDGQVWDFTERGEGFRSTTSMIGKAGLGHGNLHWTANFDELQDFENDIRNGFSGTGFLTDDEFRRTEDPLGSEKKAGLSNELDAMAAYVSSLNDFGRSPYREADGALSQDAQAGEMIFLSEMANCTTCHLPLEEYLDRQIHNVGTLTEESGQAISMTITGIETPTLRGLWATAPYLHHGGGTTLSEVFTSHRISEDESSMTISEAITDPRKREQLIKYLLSIE